MTLIHGCTKPISHYRISHRKRQRTLPQSTPIMPYSLPESPSPIFTRKPKRVSAKSFRTFIITVSPTWILRDVSGLTAHYAVNPKNGKPSGMIAKEMYEIVRENAETLDSAIIYDRDFHYNLLVLDHLALPAMLTSSLASASRHWSALTSFVSMEKSLSVHNRCLCV